MKPLKVLVTNARRRKAIPIVRALAGAGMQVICADSTHWAAAFYSRYCNERLVHPEVRSEKFLDFMTSWLSRSSCDVVFPLDDDVLEVLSKNRSFLPNPNVLLLPEHDILSKTNNKSWIIPYASKVGIAVPNTVIVTTSDDLEQLSNIQLPVIVKPSYGSGSRGIIRVKEIDKLRSICTGILEVGSSVVVQEQLPMEGEGLGYFALYDRNRELVAQFMHRRLREYPISGGPSTLREGIWDDKLACQSRNLLDSLNWVGLAMVEYKRDVRDGVPKFMEINPRFWGSIALPIFSGVNFPVLAAKLTIGETVNKIMQYPIGKKARWLWPGDILHLASSMRRGHWPKGFLKFYDTNMCDDFLSLTDPFPAIVLSLSAFRDLLSLGGWKHFVKRDE
jgi:predicted ATP-grasp superfamily ATP-dependent carboligase